MSSTEAGSLGEKVLCHSGDLQAFATELKQSASALPRRVNVDPDKVEKGLAQLVLTLIELLRQLMERQAIRRVESGSLTDDEIERMGETFEKLEVKMKELLEVFELTDEDLNIDLGPLGRLL